MSNYLRISTVGEAQPEAFTVLGASSARGDVDKIGQFGSGAKHAILCALRVGLQILIYCGTKKIVPQTQPQTIHGVLQERVCFRIGNKLEVSSITLDFGSLDWTNPIPMMLRELISNALDAVGGVWKDVSIDYVEKPRARAGYTSVFVELNEEIREYLSNLHHNFLHVQGEQDKTLLPQNPMPCKFYRKGVLVHTIEGSKSLYSYNCGDDLPIDESRNLDEYRVRGFATRLLCRDKQAVKHVLNTLVTSDQLYYEHAMTWGSMDDSTVVEAGKELWGEDCCVTTNPVTYSRAQSKGLNVVLLPEVGGWFQSLKMGIDDAASRLGKADADGLTVYPAGETLTYNVATIWDCLKSCQLTGQLEKPEILKEYTKPMNAGSETHGFYEPVENALYIHRDHVDNWRVIIEELAHYITKANDETRDFQDYAFGLSAELMKRLVI